MLSNKRHCLPQMRFSVLNTCSSDKEFELRKDIIFVLQVFLVDFLFGSCWKHMEFWLVFWSRWERQPFPLTKRVMRHMESCVRVSHSLCVSFAFSISLSFNEKKKTIRKKFVNFILPIKKWKFVIFFYQS